MCDNIKIKYFSLVVVCFSLLVLNLYVNFGLIIYGNCKCRFCLVVAAALRLHCMVIYTCFGE